MGVESVSTAGTPQSEPATPEKPQTPLIVFYLKAEEARCLKDYVNLRTRVRILFSKLSNKEPVPKHDLDNAINAVFRLARENPNEAIQIIHGIDAPKADPSAAAIHSESDASQRRHGWIRRVQDVSVKALCPNVRSQLEIDPCALTRGHLDRRVGAESRARGIGRGASVRGRLRAGSTGLGGSGQPSQQGWAAHQHLQRIEAQGSEILVDALRLFDKGIKLVRRVATRFRARLAQFLGGPLPFEEVLFDYFVAEMNAAGDHVVQDLSARPL
jgi:hypothetical protein